MLTILKEIFKKNASENMFTQIQGFVAQTAAQDKPF